MIEPTFRVLRGTDFPFRSLKDSSGVPILLSVPGKAVPPAPLSAGFPVLVRFLGFPEKKCSKNITSGKQLPSQRGNKLLRTFTWRIAPCSDASMTAGF